MNGCEPWVSWHYLLLCLQSDQHNIHPPVRLCSWWSAALLEYHIYPSHRSCRGETQKAGNLAITVWVTECQLCSMHQAGPIERWGCSLCLHSCLSWGRGQRDTAVLPGCLMPWALCKGDASFTCQLQPLGNWISSLLSPAWVIKLISLLVEFRCERSEISRQGCSVCCSRGSWSPSHSAVSLFLYIPFNLPVSEISSPADAPNSE